MSDLRQAMVASVSDVAARTLALQYTPSDMRSGIEQALRPTLAHECYQERGRHLCISGHLCYR